MFVKSGWTPLVAFRLHLGFCVGQGWRHPKKPNSENDTGEAGEDISLVHSLSEAFSSQETPVRLHVLFRARMHSFLDQESFNGTILSSMASPRPRLKHPFSAPRCGKRYPIINLGLARRRGWHQGEEERVMKRCNAVFVWAHTRGK